MKEPSRFWSFLPDFSSFSRFFPDFFLFLPIFFLIFPIFDYFFTIKGVLCPPYRYTGYATASHVLEELLFYVHYEFNG